MRKLRGWRVPNTRFVVMRDQDAGQCEVVKSRLQALCAEAGRDDALVRVACHALESFYLGDLAAVERGLDIGGLSTSQVKKKFRTPDRLANPDEELRTLTARRYQKVGGSRVIAPHLSLDGNRSRSFQVLVSGIQKLVANWP